MRPVLIVISGSVGAGKTTLAYKIQKYWQSQYDQPCEIIEDDTERRHYLGFSLQQHMHSPHYTKKMDDIMFGIMKRKTKEQLAKEHCVIRTIVVASEEHYQLNSDCANEFDADFIGFYLKASEQNIRARIQTRAIERESLDELSIELGHASNADERLLDKFPIPENVLEHWIIINADQGQDKVLEEITKHLSS